MPESHEIGALVAASKKAVEHAYAPYSGFKVGAAVLGASGRIYTGCNVENASYGLSVCAERTAVFKAISEGERAIRAVAISNSSGKAAFPCGACRQVIAEFAPAGETVTIYLVSDQGVETYTLADLLPHVFKLETSP
ncbi:MAG TPA: cytidine deaminase [Armatimonadota bacterium]|nr:cytidine deaminase [Armatimonadota bacterium]